MQPCEICSGEADKRFERVEIWRDNLWRVTMHSRKALGGFCYLEPLRHIPSITDLDGPEAATFGAVLARVTKTLKAATNSTLIYVYIYGGTIPHLHVHLAPHREGQSLYCEAIVHDEIDEAAWTPQELRAFRAAFG